MPLAHLHPRADLGRALRTGLAVCLGLLTLLPPARAAIDCWMDAEHPRSGDSLQVTDGRIAPLRETVHELNAILHRQPELHALPRTRLRSFWQIGGQWAEPARAASFLLRDHRESMWRGACDVLAGADRLEPRATIVASFNQPQAFFETAAPEISDEQLQAWREVPASGSLQGHTVYGGHMLVFTRNGRLPWVPVSNAEYLDFTLRDLRSKLKESGDYAAAQKRAYNDELLQRVADNMRKIDPAGADKLLAEMRQQMADSRAAEEAAARRRAQRGLDDAPLQTMIQRVQAWRASLTPPQLAAPARLGVNGLHREDVPISRHAPLVKPDPAFPWDRSRPAQLQMLMVSVRGNDDFEQPMQRVLQALDVKALQALVMR